MKTSAPRAKHPSDPAEQTTKTTDTLMSSIIIGFIAAAIFLTAAAVALVVTPLLRRRAGAADAPIAATVSAVVLPALALMIYISVSNYDWLTSPSPATRAEPAPGNLDMSGVVRQLEARLAASPEDAQGWLLLGRSYQQLGLLEQARMAFTQAFEREPSNEARLSVAEVDIMIDRANLGGEAGAWVEAVLADEPDNPRALFYGGMVARQRGDLALVRARWQRLLAMSPPENIRELLVEQLDLLGSTSPPAVAASGGVVAAAGDGGIDVSIRIADGLAERVAAGATLFLVARDPGVPGPPVAVVRTSAGLLPASLRISDAHAMIPGRSLSALAQLRLIARVSNGGDAIAVSGDLFGELDWQTGDAGPLSIVIDRVVE